MAGGKAGFTLGLRPKRYRDTKQQKLMREASEHCGIRKGITREELVTAMTECVPEFWKKVKEAGGNSPAS